MLTIKELVEAREQIQQDLICVLDGADQGTLDRVCQVIVDRFKILKHKLAVTQNTIDIARDKEIQAEKTERQKNQ